jgi:hypothetical protein
MYATTGGMTETAKTKAKTFQIEKKQKHTNQMKYKNKNHPIDVQILTGHSISTEV